MPSLIHHAHVHAAALRKEKPSTADALGGSVDPTVISQTDRAINTVLNLPSLKLSLFFFFFFGGGEGTLLPVVVAGPKNPCIWLVDVARAPEIETQRTLLFCLPSMEIYRPGKSGPASLCIVVLLRPSPPAVSVQTTIGKLVLNPTGRSHRSPSHLVVQHQLYFHLVHFLVSFLPFFPLLLGTDLRNGSARYRLFDKFSFPGCVSG